MEDGYRKGDVNLPEARFIVDEIKAIVADPNMGGRSIGVVSLLADKQALLIWERLTDELGPEVMQRHHIACGDARTFQGKERDIMFLSMVSAPNEVGAPLSRDTFAQRFNVAASRARDRMYLVRSVELEHLSEADRLAAQSHRTLRDTVRPGRGARGGPAQTLRVAVRARDVRRTHAARLLGDTSGAGRPVPHRHGGRGAQRRSAGDRVRRRQVPRRRTSGPTTCSASAILERAGWVFWRCFASAFIRRRKEMLDDLLKTLAERGIEPIGAEGAPRSVHTEHRVVSL